LFFQSDNKSIAAALNFDFITIELELAGNSNGLAIPAHEESSFFCCH